MDQNDIATRLEKLESHLVWQDEVLDTLDRTVAQMQETLRLQQDQLRYLYRKLHSTQAAEGLDLPTDERPPHY